MVAFKNAILVHSKCGKVTRKCPDIMIGEGITVEVTTTKCDQLFDACLELGLVCTFDKDGNELPLQADVVINDNRNLITHLHSYRRTKKNSPAWQWLRLKIDHGSLLLLFQNTILNQGDVGTKSNS